MFKSILLLISCFLFVSCQHQTPDKNWRLGKNHTTKSTMNYDAIESAPPRTAEPPAPPDYFLEKGSKIIKSGSIKFEVTNLELAKTKVDTVLNRCHGYYENEQFNSYGNSLSYTLVLRIPNLKFDSLINDLESGVGHLKSKNLNAEDVTEEYVDLNIRLDNNLAYVDQYKTILKRAKTVKEILEVQEKIRGIEEEINSKKGRLKFLEDKVNYSTLNLELTELIESNISNQPSLTTQLMHAFNAGAQNFLSFVIGLIRYWPFLVVLLLVFVGRKPIRNIIRLRRKKSVRKNNI